ncbi:winged helix-turn-helix transcriptional regulator [Haloplanus aerogenes]|uniref:ArsR family transcriptional regulator n=1 Tax=Haloplanus aerogenes TaxID=660522 RepID=A0A3M0DH21_9EURY|nr:helix-turn-helix domain-containing protein [Haloplanus aerogenes]AZH26102.1 ArsR family transcriptional regulator [Haloplanus aerogenes]RMB18449.1 helix-turn-helix protein [Haloplanus aerogenes]
MTAQRDRIHQYVAGHPGVHFNKLARELDLATGQLQYHLKKLRRTDDVVAESLYGRTHYYTPEYDDWERGAVAVLHRETARDVLLYLIEAGPSAPAPVASDLDIARSTLEWHLDHLIEQNLVEKRRDDRGHVTLALSRPVETAELLRLIEPTVPERLVDRFTRLVDNLVGE